MQRKITKIKLDKLFGNFDYEIDLSPPTGKMKILTAPNGFGKSTILKIIHSFASGNIPFFTRIIYNNITVSLDDGTEIKMIRTPESIDKHNVDIYINNEKITTETDPLFVNDKNGNYYLESTYQFLRRLGPEKWVDNRTGEKLNLNQVVALYGDYPVPKRRARVENSIESIVKDLNVRIIPNDRYYSDYDYLDAPSVSSEVMVDKISLEIKERIQKEIRKQFEDGRKKETTFPGRIIESLKYKDGPTKDQIDELLKKVQDIESKYISLGILPKQNDVNTISNVFRSSDSDLGSTEEAGRIVLKTYFEDILEKFKLLEMLSKQLELFIGSVNSMVFFKKIEISSDKGIVAKDLKTGNELYLSLLSSGEQHLIVLLGNLIFNTPEDTLVLVDEPEISMHLDWQEKFIRTLENINNLIGFSSLIATHSPNIIGNRWELVIELAEQTNK